MFYFVISVNRLPNNAILSESGNYMKYFLTLFLTVSILSAQTEKPFIFTGKLRHANTYTEIPDAYVYIFNSSTGVISAADGSFSLIIPNHLPNHLIVFEHVAFDTMHISLAKALNRRTFYLKPRIIQHEAVSVVAYRERPEFLLDLPTAYSTIKAKTFENRAYIDAGDLLATDQSIQIDEKLSGKKTIALRAGNPDDALVLYNGIKLNSLFDNVSDLSQISLDDIKQFEIIRGSNTSLYGPEAFSGVINIVPQLYKNYTARFNQKIGSYSSGSWGIQLHHTFKNKAALSYSFKKGNSKRVFTLNNRQEQLQNKQQNHFASLVYNLATGKKPQNVNIIYLYSELQYANSRYKEDLSDNNRLLSLAYNGPLFGGGNTTVSAAYKDYDNRHDLQSGTVRRLQGFLNQSYYFNLQTQYSWRFASLLTAGQFEMGELKYHDSTDDPRLTQAGIESSVFNRNHLGLVSVFKIHTASRSTFLKQADVDVSWRFDQVKNELSDIQFRERQGSLPDVKNWQAMTYKFSSHFTGQSPYFATNAYLNFSSNVKFPSLYQQISSPKSSSSFQGYANPNLNPEKNKSLEVGLELSKENEEFGPVNGWQLTFNYFQNYYQNKFRVYYVPGTPISFYDNVPNASLAGLELNGKGYLLSSKLILETGISHYSISEKAAFPFKSEWKYIGNIEIAHRGYSFQIHSFLESNQSAWVRAQNGRYWEIELPGYMNLDLHFSKTLELRFLTFLFNASVRNLVQDDTQLEGIAIRDRRYYLTFTIQY